MRIKKEETALLVVDLQEKLVPAMADAQELTRRAVMLMEGLKQFEIPTVVLRQYPKGLGDVIPAVQEVLGQYDPMDKLAYSAMQDEAIAKKMQALKAQGIKNVIVCGVESHICVLQTCTDLQDCGMQALMVCDAVGSRSGFDKEIAMRRAVAEGVLLTTVESILFELCKVAGTAEFKVISKLIV